MAALFVNCVRVKRGRNQSRRAVAAPGPVANATRDRRRVQRFLRRVVLRDALPLSRARAPRVHRNRISSGIDRRRCKHEP